MPKKKRLVTLSAAEREQFGQLLHIAMHATRKATNTRILLKGICRA